MNIGFLGTGLMGQPMVLRLLEAKLNVIAYNRTLSKLQPLQAAGGKIVSSPEAVIKASDCIFLMLSDRPAIEQVLLSSQSLPHVTNRTIIQMGTIAPLESRAIRDAVVNAGGEYLEAPVLGSIPQVKTGELIVMVGSTPEQFEGYLPLLQHFSNAPMHVGEVGQAAAMKLALNQLIAGLTATFALSLGFVSQQGVNIEQFMSVVRQSALYAPTFDKKLSRMREGNYSNPNFPTKHLLKDTHLFLEQARILGLDTSSLEGIKQLIDRAIALELADADYSAIYSAIVLKK
ncbi:MAG: NAD(P)-dependent oxidoreductase [Pleurocapsa sp.]